MVRAPSLYLGGPWFESRQAYQTGTMKAFPMMFLPIICLALAGFVAAWAHHEQSHPLYMVSFALLVAALVTAFMSYLAYSIV